MASLKNQLSNLKPLLNKNIEEIDVLRDLFAAHSEEYYERHQGNIIHQLGLMPDQIKFFTFDSKIDAEKIFEKIKKLLVELKITESVEFKNDKGWKTIINNKEFPLGNLKFGYNWVVNEYELLNVPSFYGQLVDCLQPIITTGSFYYGIMKDEDNRNHQDFVFFILFIDEGQESILSNFKKFEWKKLGRNKIELGAIDSGRVRSINYKVYEDKTVLNWKSRSNTLTGILFVIICVLVVGVIDQLIGFSEHDIPYIVFIYVGVSVVPLWILDYFNRLVHVVADEEKIVLRKGYLPFFPGFRRKTFYYKDTIRIWTKLKTSLNVGTDSYVPDSEDYYVYVTSKTPKEIRFSNSLDKSESTLLEGKLKERWKKFAKPN